jgi:hypothetical protein
VHGGDVNPCRCTSGYAGRPLGILDGRFLHVVTSDLTDATGVRAEETSVRSVARAVLAGFDMTAAFRRRIIMIKTETTVSRSVPELRPAAAPLFARARGPLAIAAGILLVVRIAMLLVAVARSLNTGGDQPPHPVEKGI